MDFTEIFTALETGIIDGADASNIATNVSLGLYDIVKHTNYPGFHSMPSDHLACNKAIWDGMPEGHRRIISVAMESLAFKTSMQVGKGMTAAASKLASEGVTLHDWSLKIGPVSVPRHKQHGLTLPQHQRPRRFWPVTSAI